MGTSLHRRRAMTVLAAFLLAPRSAQADRVADIAVSVNALDEGFEILVSLTVDAPQIAVWNVLTDFDRMAGIVSNLRSSRVLSRVGNRLVVEQSGVEAEGPLQVAFHSVREVELNPTASMHARLIHGSMRRLEGWTRLAPSRDGTLVTSRGEVDAGGWVPPLITPHFIRRATVRQYAEMRQEMLRRAGKS